MLGAGVIGMKRFTRMVIATAVGLFLGWYVAGIVPEMTVSRAQDIDHRVGDSSVQRHAQNPGHGSPVTAGGDHARPGNGGANLDDHHDPAVEAAKLLVPGSEDMPWFGSVMAVVLGLFVAAVVLGVPVLKLRRDQSPPEPVADHGH